MKLSRWEEIAIAVLVACALGGEGLVRTEAAARAAAASKDQTAQVVLALRGAGLVETIRGPQGGLRLAFPAELITLADVLHRVGSRARLDESPIPPGNPLGRIVHAATARADDILASFTIADIARDDVSGKLVCLDCPIRLGVMTNVAGGAAATEPS